MSSLRERIASGYAAYRASIGKFVFEIVIVFIGVTAAFALEGMRQQADEARYRSSIISALVPTLDDVLRHNAIFERETELKLATFDAAIARHEQPALPIFREPNAERPPVRVWDAVVSTGAARALDPDLLFQLAQFYNRQESLGERYVRYATFTEEHVLTLGSDRTAFYDASGKLRPEFAAYVDRLRDLLAASRSLTSQARTLRSELTQHG
ncbi:MAG: hypothetical protein JSS00_10740 [Proteobacteria bacterium]|nr:hypothetical protein [Pseudomonadota bacterium]